MEKTNLASAGAICIQAAELVAGTRAKAHGDIQESFQVVANLWNSYIEARGIIGTFESADVAKMLILLKLARTITGELNLDNFIDMAGYAGIAGQLQGQT